MTMESPLTLIVYAAEKKPSPRQCMVEIEIQEYGHQVPALRCHQLSGLHNDTSDSKPEVTEKCECRLQKKLDN